ncbi:MAG: hypothetical protein V2B14_01975 [bacterium]
MNDLIIMPKPKPIKAKVIRMGEFWAVTNPYKTTNSIIKDYIYSSQKRVIA